MVVVFLYIIDSRRSMPVDGLGGHVLSGVPLA